MNYKRAYLEICKDIINNEYVRGQEANDDLMLIIPPDGFYGYYLKKDNIPFNKEKLRMIPTETRKIIDLEIAKPENEIKLTNHLILMDYRKGMVRKFSADGKEVWVNADFLKNLDLNASRFYQEKDEPFSAILAEEDGEPTMCILPMKVRGAS